MTDTPDPASPTGPGAPTSDPDEVAARVLEKLRGFVSSLDDDERAVLAALLAPGVAGAYHDSPAGESGTESGTGTGTGTGTEEDDLPEVVGFSADVAAGGPEGAPARAWQPDRLAGALAARVRREHLRVEID